MDRIKYILITVAAILFCYTAQAQIKVNESASEQEVVQGVIIHADPRLAVLEKKHRNIQLGVIRSGKGYRVQIYNGNDRNRANEIKVDFMRRFPGVRTYLTYVQPQFRVKVGDYRTREEAHTMYTQVSPLYNPSMIVPDIVMINTLKDE